MPLIPSEELPTLLNGFEYKQFPTSNFRTMLTVKDYTAEPSTVEQRLKNEILEYQAMYNSIGNSILINKLMLSKVISILYRILDEPVPDEYK